VKDEFKGRARDVTEENIQARIRGTLLMAVSNKTGKMVLTTGNKSEMAVGYATLYGDMAGGYGAIKDVLKTMVYRLAEYAPHPAVIPRRVQAALLRPNWRDQEDRISASMTCSLILERYWNGPVAGSDHRRRF
jgi:NAD+ synthase (glutamine-hydrolysing)